MGVIAGRRRGALIHLGRLDASLPHMAFTTGAFDGAPLRVARVSFTGDRSVRSPRFQRVAPGVCARLAGRLASFGGGLLGLDALSWSCGAGRPGFPVDIEAPWLESLLGWLDGVPGDAGASRRARR